MNIDDNQLYAQTDFSHQITTELKRSDIHYAVYIAAPKQYNLDSGNKFPIFISTKENNIDNEDINTSRNGQLIFSNNTTADIFVVSTFVANKNIPVTKSTATSPTPANAPAGWKPPKSTFYRSEYRVLNSNNLPGIPGDWTLIEHSGNFTSNQQQVKFEYNHDSETTATRYIDNSFPTIDDLGVVLNFTNKPDTNNPVKGFIISSDQDTSARSETIFTEFNLSNTIDLSRGYLPIFMILSNASLQTNKIVGIKVPLEHLRKNDKNIQGFFSINVLNLLSSMKIDTSSISKELYLTLISGPEVSAVFSVSLP